MATTETNKQVASPNPQDGSTTPLVPSERSGTIAILTLANPARRNALSQAMLTELREQLRALAADSSVKCVILRAGRSAFSAGHDLRELQAATEPELTAIFALCTQVME